MHPTVRANQQHRLDAATGAWTRARKGVYENYDGWKIVNERGGWMIYRPDGTRADIWRWSSLIVAKCEVDTKHAVPAPGEDAR